MMRSLWTAATGMIAQQTNVDTISNNLANINTTGYKKETAEFKSLLYQTIRGDSYDTEGNPKPVGVQIGLGVRNDAISGEFDQGAFQESSGPFDFAIEGVGWVGFFRIQMPDGTIGYTRNGNFNVSMGNGGLTLCTSEGYPVLDTTGAPITFDADTDTSKLQFDDYGNILYTDDTNNTYELGIRISCAQFNNPAGLTRLSNSIFKESPASGEPRIETVDAGIRVSKIVNGYLEASNVQAVDEMVDLIIAQRAYEMNSKAITASDEMLQQANNLRG